ncbi:electron transfer flavoprotein subunit beta/FixA family protein [Microbacterium sp. CIAB417]|uniref:electron transfer flavoprotein subunit beta/FixA family protein n=1 Tax=Microbacterium sp. CIAB417 TaxID=2860287 RepID=UPI001FAC395E|nr:electron transfer flavoprotein subunit beta/FixA family protein [Microbacterium sp. CIAB417]
MRIVVLVKEVPDTYGDRVLDLETGLADRAASDRVIDEIGERALEAALSYADAHPGTEVVAMMMAADEATPTLRKALALGAGSAVQIVDDALRGADLGLTAQVLAAAIARTGFDLVIAGNQSTDGVGGVIPAMIAERLGVASATGLARVELAEDAVEGDRPGEGAVRRIRAELPAVISITEAMPEARMAGFKGVMAAKKKPIETLSLADLAIDADDPTVARSIMIAIAPRPARAAGQVIVDDGDGGNRLAEFLIQNRLV